MDRTIRGTPIVLLAVFLLAAPSRAGTVSGALRATLASARPGADVPVIVALSGRTDVAPLMGRRWMAESSRKERRAGLLRALKSRSESAQGPLIDFLRGIGARRIRPLWINHSVAAVVPAAAVDLLASQPGVELVRLDAEIPGPKTVRAAPAAAAPPEWNIDAIRAPELWALGHLGAGIVVATMDTGVDPDHPDLAPGWRGGANSWYDPNGEHPAVPYDPDGHGTQVMGLLTGADSGGTSIGVAPGAKWIAVKIFADNGVAQASAIHQGFQWLLDPDADPGTDDAPDLVNNSWGLRTNVGQCVPEFEPDVQALRTAGIAVVFAGGNEGPADNTSLSPANHAESFAVGSVDVDNVAELSGSRGPSACDGSIYPDVVAPGVVVKSSDLTFGGVFPDSYMAVSGTSFAAPHVSGTMALLLGAFPGMMIQKLETAIRSTAVDLGAAGPDNVYGYGMLDAKAAYDLLAGDADGDGFAYYQDCPAGDADNDSTIHPGAPEVKHDGIDQDCNGYDLTIDIVVADYRVAGDTLTVEATSGLGASADLALAGFGPMTWDAVSGKWKLSVAAAGGDPGTVTVQGVEGAETAQTTVVPGRFVSSGGGCAVAGSGREGPGGAIFQAVLLFLLLAPGGRFRGMRRLRKKASGKGGAG